MVEALALVLFLFVLLLGAVEAARFAAWRWALEDGVARATRYLSVNPGDGPGAVAIVQDALDRAPLGRPPSPPSVQAYDEWGSPISWDTLAILPFGDRFRLEATLQASVRVPLVASATYTLRAGSEGIVERFP